MADTSSDDILNQIVNQLLAKQTGGNALTDVGQVLGSAAVGNAAGVNSANTTALAGGALSNNLFQSALERAKLQAALPNFRAQQAVTGDQIANTQDVVPTGPPNVMSHVVNFTGGRRPSNLGPNARSAGAALSGIGAANIGKDVLPAVPSMPKMSDGGVLGKLLGGGALGAGLLGALTGGGKNGGSIDITKLLSGLKRNNAPTGDPYGSSPWGPNGPSITNNLDPNFFNPDDPNATSGVLPNLPGSNIDPQQQYLDWLREQQNNNGGGDPADPTGANWWSE